MWHVLGTLLLLIPQVSQARAAFADDCAQPSTSGCPIVLNQPATAVLASGDDVHTWRLTLPGAEPLHIVLTNLPADYDVHVYAADGSLLGQSTNDGTQDDVVDLPDAGAGTYTIYVNSARGDVSAEPYSLLASGPQNPVAAPVGAAPSAEPSPVPNPPSGGGKVVLSDDFNDERTGWLPSTTLTHGYVRYLGGEYQLAKTDTGTIFPGVNIPGTFADSTTSIDVRFVDPTPNVIVNVGCRRNGTNGMNQYFARIRPQTRVAALVRTDADTPTPTTLVPDTPATVLQRDSTTHIELRCVGTELSLSLNGMPALNAQDSKYSSGSNWIGAGVSGGTSDARFSHLVVTQP